MQGLDLFLWHILFCRSLAWLWLLSCYGTDLHGVSRNGYMKYFSSIFGMGPMLLLQVSVLWIGTYLIHLCLIIRKAMFSQFTALLNQIKNQLVIYQSQGLFPFWFLPLVTNHMGKDIYFMQSDCGPDHWLSCLKFLSGAICNQAGDF